MLSLALLFLFLLQSPTPEEGFVSVNGARLYYRIVGSGEPLVMVHGGPGSNMLHLLPYCDTLSNEFKLIYYDQRGCGKSSPLSDSQSVSWKDHLEDLEGLRKVFGLEKMNLFGHSWGGGLVMLYAITYPERVRRLIISNSMPAHDGEWKEEMAATEAEFERLHGVQEKLAALDKSGLRSKDPDAYFRRYSEIKSWQIFVDTTDAAKTVYTISPCPLVNYYTWESLRGYDFRNELKRLHMPVLIIHGEQDIIPLKYAEEIHRLIPQSKLVVTRKGHQPYIEDPEKYFQSIREFLRSSSSVN
jgi:proline iminopeptidase